IYGRGCQGWRIGLKALAIAVCGALMGIIIWTIFDPYFLLPAMIRWYKLSAQERQVHPVTVANFRYLADFAYICSTAIAILAPFALIWLWSKKRRPLFWFGCCGLLADLLLLANHDLAVNPRYLMTGLPGLAAVCGWSMAELIRSYRVWTIPLWI